MRGACVGVWGGAEVVGVLMGNAKDDDDDEVDGMLGVTSLWFGPAAEAAKFESDRPNSARLTSTGVLDILSTSLPSTSLPNEVVELDPGGPAVFPNLPLTPSTAFKNPVLPAVNVLEIASLVGASC